MFATQTHVMYTRVALFIDPRPLRPPPCDPRPPPCDPRLVLIVFMRVMLVTSAAMVTNVNTHNDISAPVCSTTESRFRTVVLNISLDMNIVIIILNHWTIF